MHPNAFRCPAVSVTAAVVGGATLLAVAYYFWSRPKKSCKPSECSSANRSESLESSEESGGDGRASAGMDTQENMNSFDNENVGGIWKRKEWFMEQMKMGEDDETTVEQMAKANETESVLRGLRDAYKSIGRIQEYLTTDMSQESVSSASVASNAPVPNPNYVSPEKQHEKYVRQEKDAEVHGWRMGGEEKDVSIWNVLHRCYQRVDSSEVGTENSEQ